MAVAFRLALVFAVTFVCTFGIRISHVHGKSRLNFDYRPDAPNDHPLAHSVGRRIAAGLAAPSTLALSSGRRNVHVPAAKFLENPLSLSLSISLSDS